MKRLLLAVLSSIVGVGSSCGAPCVLPNDGGGGTGGGGGSPSCVPACPAWQSCSPSGCVNAVITAVRPASGTVFNGGDTVRFVFSVTDWDGGVWPAATVPAQTSGGVTGPSTLAKNNSAFEGDFVLANTTGMQAVRAGWVAANAAIAVTARICNANCAPWQGCVADLDGGHCDDLGLSLSWVSPSAGQEFGPSAAQAVALELNVSRADGGAFAGTVPFSLGAASGALALSTGAWRATADAGSNDGNRTVTAGWEDGGPTMSRGFVVVATPPTVTLVAQATPMRPPDNTDIDTIPRWKKNELALVQVESNRLLNPVQPTDFTTAGGAAPSVLCSRSCPGANFCQCFAVDLARQTLTAPAGSISGTISVGLSRATDTLGNVNTSIAAQNFPVTRLKWRRDIATTALPMGVAIAPDGKVITGASASLGTTSAVVALMPDGGTAWSNTYANEYLTAPPLVGTQAVYFGVANPGASTASIRKVAVSDGQTPTSRCFGAQPLWGDMALVSPGNTEAVVAVRSDARIVPSTTSCDQAIISTSPTPSAANWPSLVAIGTDAFLGMSARAPIWKFTTADTVPVSAGSATTTTLFPSNLFVLGTNLVGGGGPTVGGAFAVLAAGTLSGSTLNATGADTGGAAIVGGAPDAGVVFYGDTGGNLRLIPLNPVGPSFGAIATQNLSGTASFSERAALLGKGGHLYVVGSDGTLRVLNSMTMAEEWRWDSAFPTTKVSPLNMDINRDALDPCGPGQPGVLYVAASSGAATKLYAVLVDSAGLERSAPWPRHQHDPANTGNPATQLTPWTCP